MRNEPLARSCAAKYGGSVESVWRAARSSGAEDRRGRANLEGESSNGGVEASRLESEPERSKAEAADGGPSASFGGPLGEKAAAPAQRRSVSRRPQLAIEIESEPALTGQATAAARFPLAPNAGQESDAAEQDRLRGETARVMLALKTVTGGGGRHGAVCIRRMSTPMRAGTWGGPSARSWRASPGGTRCSA